MLLFVLYYWVFLDLYQKLCQLYCVIHCCLAVDWNETVLIIDEWCVCGTGTCVSIWGCGPSDRRLCERLKEATDPDDSWETAVWHWIHFVDSGPDWPDLCWRKKVSLSIAASSCRCHSQSHADIFWSLNSCSLLPLLQKFQVTANLCWHTHTVLTPCQMSLFRVGICHYLSIITTLFIGGNDAWYYVVCTWRKGIEVFT